MAAKKKTKKTSKKQEEEIEEVEEKKETKKTTSKKKTTKKSDKIKLTYQPIGFNAKQMTFSLKKKDVEGRSTPLIEGLPMQLTVGVGEVIEVTQEQFEALQLNKCVESDEEYQKRVDFLKGMKDQYPKTFSDAEIAREKGQLISAQESQRMIYNDKLIRCD